MRAERSPSQILFNFLPQQTVDLEGRIWKIKEWRDPERLAVDESAVRRRLLGAVHPWSSSGRDNFAGQQLHEGHSLEVVGLNKARGVSVELWPLVFVCQDCRRIGSDPGRPCRCGRRRWSQLQFVGFHECGYATPPWIPLCPEHADARINTPGTAQAKDLRFTCPECGRELLKGLGAGRKCHGCGQMGISYTVHRAANVYTPYSLTMVNPARPEQLQALQLVGGATRCLDWVVDGMEGDRPQAAPASANTLIEQLMAAGLSHAAATAAAQAAAAQGHQFSGGGSAGALPADKAEPAKDDALDIAVGVYNGRTTIEALAKQTTSPDLKLRFSDCYPAALSLAGMQDIALVDRFPVLRGVFGYAREANSPQSRLVMFRGSKGSYRVYGDTNETEALFLRLDPIRVARWLKDRGHLASAPTTARDARLAILAAAEIPQRGEEVLQETAGSAVLSLLHSMAHRLIRSLAVFAGIDRDALSEYLVPRHLAMFVYAASRGDFVLGGLQAVFENDLDDLLKTFVNGEARCPLDPGCQRATGACPACLHLGEPSCSYYNSFLDRGTLFGAAGYLHG